MATPQADQRPATTKSTPAAPRKRLVLLLAGAAGCLDAVGYLMLGLFTANMTGNTILLGLSVGREAWADAMHNVAALAAFVCGAGAGTAATRGAGRIARGLGFEAAVLAAAVGVWSVFGAPRGRIGEPAAYWLIALLSGAMGMQSATVRRVGEHRVATTYVTGTLTTLATDTASDLLDRWMGRAAGRAGPPGADSAEPAPAPASISLLPASISSLPAAESAGGPPSGGPPARDRGTALMTGLWLVYLAGALVGGFAESRWAMAAVLVPAVVLVAVMASDVSHRPKEGLAR